MNKQDRPEQPTGEVGQATGMLEMEFRSRTLRYRSAVAHKLQTACHSKVEDKTAVTGVQEQVFAVPQGVLKLTAIEPSTESLGVRVWE